MHTLVAGLLFTCFDLLGKLTRVPWKAIEVDNPKGVKMRKVVKMRKGVKIDHTSVLGWSWCRLGLSWGGL